MRRRLAVSTRRALGVFVAAAWVGSCGPIRPCVSHCDAALPPLSQPDPASPPATVRLIPTAAWTDTGIIVHEGDRLLFAASGEICWQGRAGSNGPDGERGQPGWNVGRGGLIGKVGLAGASFDVGARTGLFPDRHARPPHHPRQPPALVMPGSGTLMLGFKAFAPGVNTGWFEISVQRAVPVARS
ncbi:MAG: hypothetical protein ABJA98_20370 [Acidobacteriota bacterium]